MKPDVYMLYTGCTFLWRDVYHKYTRCIRFAYVKPMWQCQHNVYTVYQNKCSKMGRHQGAINTVMKCSEMSILLSTIRMILICRNFHQYVRYRLPDVYLVKCSISRQPCASMSYSSEIPSNCNAHKLCILFVYSKKKNLKIKGKINNHTVMII